MRVDPKPEPLTEASTLNPPVLAVGDAYRVLLSEIERYCKRETAGRSFLVSGSRGAGKTTLVRLAIDAARRQDLRTKPLLIPLHGPNLLSKSEAILPPSPAKADLISNPPADASATITPTEQKQPSVAESTLVIITKALYRAYVDELCRAFGRKMQDRLSASAVIPKQEAELLAELAGSIQIDFDWAPSLATLRQYWERAGVLDSGVLSRKSAGPIAAPTQGMRELIAAATARDAFRLVVGSLKKGEKTGHADDRTTKSEAALDAKQLINPLLAVASGGLLGGAMLKNGADPVWTALASVATGLVAAATLNQSAKRETKATESGDEDFAWDTKLSSLDRMLPSLVERVLDAGLAPIFVVDELDKVKDLESRLAEVIPSLKQLVTERAFFCFLTDRDYYEHVQNLDLTAQPEGTFFTHHLFLTFEPEDLRKYLSRLIIPESQADTVDHLILPYVLTNWAKMHAIDLQRSLAQITNSDGTVNLQPGEVTVGGYRHAAFYQVAVEYILQQVDVRSRIRQDPDFRRLAYDALYYPCRNWNRSSSRRLDVSLPAFAKYLSERSQGKIVYPKDTQAENRGLQDLYKIMLELVRHLGNPGAFRAILEAEAAKPPGEPWAFRVPQPVIEIVPTETDQPLLFLPAGNMCPIRGEWLYDSYGKFLGPLSETTSTVTLAALSRISQPPVVDVPAIPTTTTADALASIISLEKQLGQFGLTIGQLVALSVLEKVPAWTQVQAAIERTREQRPTSEDPDTIEKFSQMILRCDAILRSALLLAGALRANNPEFFACLELVSRMTGLSARTTEQKKSKLLALVNELDLLTGTKFIAYAMDPNSPLGLNLTVIKTLANLKPPPDVITDRSLRFNTQLRQGARQKDWVFEADLGMLFAEAQDPTTFRADTRLMTVSDWAQLIAHTTENSKTHDLDVIMQYLGVITLDPGSAQPPAATDLSYLILDQPQPGAPAKDWILNITTNAVVPFYRRDILKIAMGRTSLGRPADRILLEKAIMTAQSELGSFGSFWSQVPEIPVYLIVARAPTRPFLEIQAASLEEAIEKAKSIGRERGLENWKEIKAMTSPEPQ